jgi:hypothetical protein
MKAFVEHNKVRFANAWFTTTTKPFVPSKLDRLDMNAWFLTKEYNIIRRASICDNISILKPDIVGQDICCSIYSKGCTLFACKIMNS